MSKLRKLQDERAEMIAAARATLARAYPQDGPPVMVEVEAYKDLERQLADNATELSIVMRELDAERAMEPVEQLTPGAVLPTRKRGARSYAALFGPAGDARGFQSFREFAGLIWRGQHDPRLLGAASGGSEAIPSEGGFLVPTQYSAQTLDRMLENSIVMPLADVQPMTAPTKKISGFDRSDTSGNAPAGFAGQWLDEGATATVSVPKVRQIELNARKLAIYTNATNELVQDGMQFDQLLGQELPAALAWHADSAFFTGTGAGQPLGVLNDPSLVTVTKEGSQAADTILYANLAKMFGSLHPSLVNEAVWVANPTTIPQLLQLTVTIKNVGATDNVGGSFVPVISERNGQFTILTRPVIFTEKLPVLGDKGDIILAAFSQYAVGLRKEVSLDRSIHVKWLTDESAFRCIMRLDGQGKWKAPFKNKAGTSLGWAVCIETR